MNLNANILNLIENCKLKIENDEYNDSRSSRMNDEAMTLAVNPYFLDGFSSDFSIFAISKRFSLSKNVVRSPFVRILILANRA